MKSSINVGYNAYAPKAEWNHATHLNRATRTVYPLGSQFNAARHEIMRADAFSLLGHVNTKQRCETQSVNTVCNETVRRFSIYTAPLFTMDLL